MTEILQNISTYGFPVVAAVLCGYYVYVQNKSHTEQILEINKNHTEEMMKLKESIDNNTLAITKLCERLVKNELS